LTSGWKKNLTTMTKLGKKLLSKYCNTPDENRSLIQESANRDEEEGSEHGDFGNSFHVREGHKGVVKRDIHSSSLSDMTNACSTKRDG
jgi:hypothetical protein